MGRPKGSKNKPKAEKGPEEKSALEREIILTRRKAVARKKAGEPAQVYNLIKNYDAENMGQPKGEPTGICKDCGREFEQSFSEDRNAYSSYRICPDCRKKKSIKKSENVQKKRDSSDNEQDVTDFKLPYKPYPWQIEAEDAFWNHRFTVLACGNRCLLPGAFIDGCNKHVEDLSVGDVVIGKNGNRQAVTYVDKEPYKGIIYTVKANGLDAIKCNSNHPILIAKGRKPSRDERAKIYSEEFIRAEDLYTEFWNMGKLDRMYVKIPRIKGSIECNCLMFDSYEPEIQAITGMILTEETAWMLGLYCAEGCFLDRGGCKWTLNYKEKEIADKLYKILSDMGLHVNVRERPEDGVRCLIVSKMNICRKIDKEIGHGSLNKKIPDTILYNKDESLLIAFLKGYHDGDGWVDYKNAKISASTVSETLAHQLQIAWARIGVYAKITSQQRQRFNTKGELCSKEYEVSVNSSVGIHKIGYNVRSKKPRETAIITDDAIYARIKRIDSEYGETNIIVVSTEDETFSACGFIQHNSGKDRMTIMVAIKYFVECLNENRLIKNPELVPPVFWWQIAPTEKMAKQNWRELKQYFPKEWVVACSDSNYQMETIGGGIIEVRSGYSPDDLVGVGLDLVTITEAARFKDLSLAWANLESRLNSPGRGRACDRKGRSYGAGKAIINSSPIGRNDFYDLFCYGQKSHETYSSVWWSAQYPWTCNPSNEELAKSIVHGKYGDLTYEESLRRQIGERTYRSNYLADFMAEDGAVFKKFEENCVISIYNEEKTGAKTKEERQNFIKEWKEPVLGDVYVIGYDPATGSSQDSPAVVVRHKESGRVVRMYDLYGKKYAAQYDFIAEIAKQFNYAEVHWLRTGHTAIEGEFEKRGLAEVPLDEQGQKKGQLVQTLELAVENGDVQVLYDGSVEAQTLIDQMKDYNEQNRKYANNKCPHDDFVSAMYAAFSDYSVHEIPIYYNPLMSSIELR